MEQCQGRHHDPGDNLDPSESDHKDSGLGSSSPEHFAKTEAGGKQQPPHQTTDVHNVHRLPGNDTLTKEHRNEVTVVESTSEQCQKEIKFGSLPFEGPSEAEGGTDRREYEPSVQFDVDRAGNAHSLIGGDTTAKARDTSSQGPSEEVSAPDCDNKNTVVQKAALSKQRSISLDERKAQMQTSKSEGGHRDNFGKVEVTARTVSDGVLKTPLPSESAAEEEEELDDQVFDTLVRERSHPASGSLSPLVMGDSIEDFDLPPQLMMCRRNSATVINLPRRLPQHSLRLPFERSDTAPPSSDTSPSHQARGRLMKGGAFGGFEGSSGSLSPRTHSPSHRFRRTSAVQLPLSTHLSVDLSGRRLSRSQDDLTLQMSSGVSSQRRVSSPLVSPRHRRIGGAGFFPPTHITLDIPDQGLLEGEEEVSLTSGTPAQKSSANVFHRQSSGATLCVPLQKSLSSSPAETDEEDFVDDAPRPVLKRRKSSVTVFHRQSSGVTLCHSVQDTIDLGDELIENDQQDVAPTLDESTPANVEDDVCESGDKSDKEQIESPSVPGETEIVETDVESHNESPDSQPRAAHLAKKGSIAIPLGGFLDDRGKLSELSAAKIRRFLATIRFISRLRFSESYFAVKGAALILPQSECPRTITRGSHGGDIQTHLQSMFYLLRPQDTIKVAVKLESPLEEMNRYMAVVSTTGRQDTDESVILGIDIEDDKATIGLVLPIWGSSLITLDGDGGFKVTSEERLHIFKPVSVQAMWSALQSLIKARDIANQHSYFPKGLTHTWLTYYEVRILSSQSAINEWNFMEDIESHRPDPNLLKTKPVEQLELENLIRVRLKEIMLTVDLEEVTSKYLRERLEEETGMGLRHKRQFIDEEMIYILRQMDSPSEIFPFLYLGSEWNASNLEELKLNGINHILNVTREIDNFFPGLFEYANVRVYDVEQSELLKYWDNTFKFISKAKETNSKVLVHCKMGISRSASTVIAFAMKEYGWSLDKAYEHTKSRRSCIRPNAGFMQQLVTYEGILDASKHRNNQLWRSKSVGDLITHEREEAKLSDELRDILNQPSSDHSRPRSWSPEDNTTQLLLKAQDLASDNDSSDEELRTNYTEVDNDRNREEIMGPPFLTWDDLDDVSSHSVDSLIEFNPDEPCSKHSSSYDSKPRPIVELLSYRTFSGSDGGPEGPTDTKVEASGDESDIEDFVAEETSGRVERGFYDVLMLMGNFLGPEVEGQEGDTDVPPEFINYYLHPDVKMELLMAQQRKNRRIAQILKLSQPPKEVDSEYLATPSQQTTQAKPVAGASTPQVTKLRADNSWIKEIPPSPQDPDKMPDIEEQGDVEPLELYSDPFPTEAEVEAVSSALIQPLLEVTPPTPRDRLPSDQDQPLRSSVSPSPDVDTQCLEGEACRVGVDSDSTNPELGVLQHYHKEDIPWNPGTVRRHKNDLEKRIAKDDQSSRVSSDSYSDSGSSEGLGDIEILVPEMSRSPSGPRSVSISGAEVGESSTDDPLPEGSASDLTSPPEGSITQDSQSSPEGAGSARTSIYDLEEITLEPGMVQRTKEEIEKRGSQETVEDQKPVQRSSSLKEHSPHTKKDRTSERRRTCTPVLRTGSSGEDLTSEESPSGEEKQELKVLMVGQETIEVVHGKVKKHKRAIESRGSKSECDVAEELTSPESSSEVTSPLPEYTKQRSLSLPMEVSVDIPSGAVLKQKKELESKLGSSAVATTSKETPQAGPSKPTVEQRDETSKVSQSTEEQSQSSQKTGQSQLRVQVTSKPSNSDREPSPLPASEPRSLDVQIQSKLKVDIGKTCSSAEEGYGKSPDVQDDSARVISAYPEEDIPWSVGTVRQQKEALEKVAMEKTSSQNKSPSGDDGPKSGSQNQNDRSADVFQYGNLRRSSSCKTTSGNTETQDSVSSTVSRSASLKESAHGRTELKVSLSTPTNVPVHKSQKDIIISKNSSQDQGRAEKPISPTLEAELKKFSTTKEVLILEASKKNVPETPKECSPGCSTVDLASKIASDTTATSTMKPMEEKKFWDLVDMFEKPKDPPEGSKSQDKKSTSPPEVRKQGSTSTSLGAGGPEKVEVPIQRSKSVSCRPTSELSAKVQVDRKTSLPPDACVPSVIDYSTKKTSPSESKDSETKAPTPQSSTTGGASAASIGTVNLIPLGVREPDPEEAPRKSRKLHGKSHPLAKLTGGQGPSDKFGQERSGRSNNPMYNTM